MPEHSVIVRLSVRDQETVGRALTQLGEDGERALKRIERAAREPTPAMKALGVASDETRGTLEGLGSQAGSVGQALSALGPGGLVAAAGVGALVAGVGALVAGFPALMQRSRDAIEQLDGLADSAAKLGVSAESLQELRYAFGQNGVEAATLDTALEKLNQRIGDLALNGEEATAGTVAAFDRLGVSVTDSEGRVKSAERVLAEIADALAKVEDPATRAALAKDALGKSAGALVPLLTEGGNSLAAFRQEARDLGIVIDESLVQSAGEANDKLVAMQQVVQAQLSGALVSLAPVLTTIAGAFAEVARWVGAAVDGMRAFEQRSTPGLRSKADDLRGERAGIEKQLAAPKTFWSRLSGDATPEAFEGSARARMAEIDAALARIEGIVQRRAEEVAPRSFAAPPPPVIAGGGSGRRSGSRGGGRAGGSVRSAAWEDTFDGSSLEFGAFQTEFGAGDPGGEYRSEAADKTDKAMRALDRLREANVRAQGDAVRLIELRRDRELAALGQIGLSEEKLAEARTLVNDTANREIADQYDRTNKSLEDRSEALADSARELGLTFSSAFEDAIVNGEKLQVVLQGIAEDITRLAVRKAITEPAADWLGGVLKIGGSLAVSWLSGAPTGGEGTNYEGGGSAGDTLSSARGNVFAGGSLLAFGRGGMVDHPTMFPMAQGMGLMGEKAPEAVFPIRRLPDGDLGVRGMVSMPSAKPSVQVVINNNAPVDVAQETREGPDGTVIMATIEQRVIEQASRRGSALNRAIRSAVDERGVSR